MPKLTSQALTVAFCRSAKPSQVDGTNGRRAIQTDYPDSDVRGLALRVSPGGQKSWTYRYRDKLTGKQSRVTLGAFDPNADSEPDENGVRALTLSGARVAARQLRGQVDSGADPAADRRQARDAARAQAFKTMAELADAYFAACENGTHRTGKRRKKAASTLANERWMWGKYLKPRMERDDPYKANRRSVRSVLREIYGIAPGQADKCRALLSQMFNYAADEDDDQDRANPVSRVKKMTETKARTRRLSDGELTRVWNALQDPSGLRIVTDDRDEPLQVSQTVRLAIELCMITLQRRSEVAGMKTDELDLEKKTWLIPEDRTKGRLEHLVPLSDRAVRVIGAALELHADLRTENSVHVFPSPRLDRRPIGGASLTHAMADITTALGIEDATLHDLRRTGATGMAALGVEPFVVSKVLSHQDADGAATVTNRHYNLYAYLPEKRDALDRWSAKLDVLLGGENTGSDIGGSSQIDSAGPVEQSRGTGLGELVSLSEGSARLSQYATPGPIARWAGPVANSGEIERLLGVGRTTLHRWVKTGAVVALLRGERKLSYPLDQFVDSRPLEGLADVVRLAPSPRGAWLWMRQPNGSLGGKTPLACLHDGRRTEVIQAAQTDLAVERDVA